MRECITISIAFKKFRMRNWQKRREKTHLSTAMKTYDITSVPLKHRHIFYRAVSGIGIGLNCLHMCDKKHSFINFGCFNFSKVDRILSIILRRLEKQVLAFVKKKKKKKNFFFFFFCFVYRMYKF